MKTPILAIVAGAISGIVASVLVPRLVPSHDGFAPSGAPSKPAKAAGEQGATPVLLTIAPETTRDLDERVAKLERATETASPRNVDKAPPPLESVEEAQQKHHDEHAAKLAAHAREPVDRAWARATERSLEASLTELAASTTFGLIDVVCKTGSCRA